MIFLDTDKKKIQQTKFSPDYIFLLLNDVQFCIRYTGYYSMPLTPKDTPLKQVRFQIVEYYIIVPIKRFQVIMQKAWP